LALAGRTVPFRGAGALVFLHAIDQQQILRTRRDLDDIVRYPHCCDRMSRTQYLTAVLELRPTRRKAAALERVRAAAEAVFWQVLDASRVRADVVAAEADTKARRIAWRAAEADIRASIIAACAKASLAEPVTQGVSRDALMAISSYVELRAKGHPAEWPKRLDTTADDRTAALDQFLTATTPDRESAARDALFAVARQPGPRPLVLARARDAQLVRLGPTGGIAAVLNVVRATDPTARVATIKPGVEAATGELLAGGMSKTKIVVPVSCSKWHEQKFLSGRAVLRSSLIVRRGDRWFMCAQFEFAIRELQQTGARLGIDRGIVNPVAMAVTAADGQVLTVPPPAGAEIGKSIHAADKRRKAEQKRRGATSFRHAERVEHGLHALANGVVREAKAHGAQVVFEKLDGLKQTIVTARPKGARKGGWRRTLKRAQFGKLEQILTYKLALAGLPVPREVLAGGTSVTCPACAVRDPKNRPQQDVFRCTSCRFTGHADSVAAVNIARRGVAMERITKGAKLAPLEQEITARLRLRSDCGLGPLAGDYAAASGFVAVRAAAASDYGGPACSLTELVGHKTEPCIQNVGNDVFAERDATISPARKRKKGQSDQAVLL
jgi:IS605 OrfB family transposase